MKLRMSRTTTTCPKGFVFLAFRPHWSSSQKRISGLSAPSKVKARPQVLQVVKATLWKCQRWLCERPVLKWCRGTTLPTSARLPGGAENLLLLLELIHRSSGVVTVTLIGQHTMVQLLPVSWPAAHAALGWCSCGSKSLLHNPPLWYPEGKPPYCGCTALPKNKHTAGKEHTQMCTFFISTFFHPSYGCFRSARHDTSFGFVLKELEDTIMKYNKHALTRDVHTSGYVSVLRFRANILAASIETACTSERYS